MNEQNEARKDRIRAELEAGNRSTRIANKLAVEWNLSSRTVWRFVGEVQDEMEKERQLEQAVQAAARQRRLEEKEEAEHREELLINAALVKIITGEDRIKKVFCTAKGLETSEIEPDYNSKIRAAAVYFRHKDKREREAKKNEPQQIPIYDVTINKPVGYEKEEVEMRENRRQQLLNSGMTEEEAQDQLDKTFPKAFEEKYGEECNAIKQRVVEDNAPLPPQPAAMPEVKSQISSSPSYIINPVNGEKIRTKAVYPPPPFFPYKHGYKPPYKPGGDNGYVHFKTKKRKA